MSVSFKHSLLALGLGLVLSGCGSDGKDGIDGVNGADGAKGEAGQNAPTGLHASVVGRFVTAAADREGAAEIVQYHPATNTVYSINSSGSTPTLEIIDASTLAEVSDPLTANNLNHSSFDLATEVSLGATTRLLSDANSIAIHGNLLAVAMAASAKADNGAVLFYDISTTTPVFIKAVEAGNLPDMVGFTPDGSKVLVANEGEPAADYSLDPEGSVSVISVTNGVPADTAAAVTFSAFNTEMAALAEQGIRFSNPGSSTVAQDLEPEYITASNDFAWVSLQENNAIARINLSDNSVTLHALGEKDWSQYTIDVSNKDGINFQTYPGLYGLYMPDTLASYSWNGAHFILSANEGDSREYVYNADASDCAAAGHTYNEDDEVCEAYIDEARVKDLVLDANAPFFANYDKDVLGRLKVTPMMGDTDNDGDFDKLYAFGARSFSIWDSNGLQVFDSGDDFGRISASVHGDAFNNDEDVNEGDSRSDDKGGEPEALAVGTIGDRTYAFIGQERMGSVFIYDITNPYNVSFVDYFYNRDLSEGLEVPDIDGDLAPEGMAFVTADNSPTGEALLIIGNEISGSVTIWQITPR